MSNEDIGSIDGNIQATKKASRTGLSQKRRQMRMRLWPLIEDEHLWLRTKSVGFTTIPRTLPIVNRILDIQAGKGFPVSATYLALWCHVFDEGFIEVRNSRELAYESGFGGPRAEATWKTRMKKLESLGVIQSKPGMHGDYQYILMLNPYQVIEKLYENKPKDFAFQALLSRMLHVGADDIVF